MLKRVLQALSLGTVALLSAVSLAQDASPLAVTEIVTARGYDRATGAVDPTTTFAHDSGNVVVVVRLTNSSGAEQDIRVGFERDEGEPASSTAPGGVALHIPASRRYRTVARGTTNRPPGNYRAVVRGSDGSVLGSVDFTITE
jgi:hypothetical protein